MINFRENYNWLWNYVKIIDLNDEMNCVKMWKLVKWEGNLQKEEGNFYVSL
jgi:hypothetical protein